MFEQYKNKLSYSEPFIKSKIVSRYDVINISKFSEINDSEKYHRCHSSTKSSAQICPVVK